jgi:hypothetical protein
MYPPLMASPRTSSTELGRYLSGLFAENEDEHGFRHRATFEQAHLSIQAVQDIMLGLRHPSFEELNRLVDAITDESNRAEGRRKARELWAEADIVSRARRLGADGSGLASVVDDLQQKGEASLARKIVREMRQLFDKAERRAKVGQWVFFGLGVLVSIPVGFLVNLLTR